MNPTTNDECGLLVDGFDSPPAFMMPYNPRYYTRLMEAEGLGKAKDLLAYRIDFATLPMDRLTRIAAKVRERNPNLVFRPVKRKTLERDLGKVNEVYNAHGRTIGLPSDDAAGTGFYGGATQTAVHRRTALARGGGESRSVFFSRCRILMSPSSPCAAGS